MTGTQDYSNKNAEAVLSQVRAHMAELKRHNEDGYNFVAPEGAYNKYSHRGYEGHKGWMFKISAVCDELSIFDWWNETLSMSQLKQMETFLVQAIQLGFTGYVCFKVGASGCSHGMWAHKEESTNGYSPDGDCIHHSFRSGDNYFDMKLDGKWMRDLIPGAEDRWQFTLAEVKQVLADRERRQRKLLGQG